VTIFISKASKKCLVLSNDEQIYYSRQVTRGTLCRWIIHGHEIKLDVGKAAIPEQYELFLDNVNFSNLKHISQIELKKYFEQNKFGSGSGLFEFGVTGSSLFGLPNLAKKYASLSTSEKEAPVFGSSVCEDMASFGALASNSGENGTPVLEKMTSPSIERRLLDDGGFKTFGGRDVYGLSNTFRELKNYWHEISPSGNNDLDYVSFSDARAAHLAEQVFDSFDDSNTGVLPISSFSALVRQLGHELSTTELLEEIEMIDEDGTGYFDRWCFIVWYTKTGSQRPEFSCTVQSSVYPIYERGSSSSDSSTDSGERDDFSSPNSQSITISTPKKVPGYLRGTASTPSSYFGSSEGSPGSPRSPSRCVGCSAVNDSYSSHESVYNTSLLTPHSARKSSLLDTTPQTVRSEPTFRYNIGSKDITVSSTEQKKTPTPKKVVLSLSSSGRKTTIPKAELKNTPSKQLQTPSSTKKTTLCQPITEQKFSPSPPRSTPHTTVPSSRITMIPTGAERDPSVVRSQTVRVGNLPTSILSPPRFSRSTGGNLSFPKTTPSRSEEHKR